MREVLPAEMVLALDRVCQPGKMCALQWFVSIMEKLTSWVWWKWQPCQWVILVPYLQSPGFLSMPSSLVDFVHVDLTAFWPFHIFCLCWSPWSPLCSLAPFQLQLLQLQCPPADAEPCWIVLGLASPATPSKAIVLQIDGPSPHPQLTWPARNSDTPGRTQRGCNFKAVLFSLTGWTTDLWKCLPNWTELGCRGDFHLCLTDGSSPASLAAARARLPAQTSAAIVADKQLFSPDTFQGDKLLQVCPEVTSVLPPSSPVFFLSPTSSWRQGPAPALGQTFC